MANADILEDPAWFPDRIDAENRLVRLVHTRHDILAESGFLDGRTPLSDRSTTCILPFEDFVAGLAPAPAMRWIFHASFCGSTLLARVATVAGHGLCLREPQILTDLSERKIALAGTADPLLDRMLDASLAKLSQRWRPGELIVIKPSNWVNPILPELWCPQRQDRTMIVAIGRDDFLVAVLRGGRDRIAYTLRLFERFEARSPLLAPIVTGAMPAGTEPMLQASCLIVALHWAQNIVMAARCIAAGIDPADITLDFPHFLDDPAGNATRLAAGLDLPIAEDTLAASVAHHLPRHSKTGGVAPQDEAVANHRIRTLHRESIAAATAFGQALDSHSQTVIAASAAAMARQDREGFDRGIHDARDGA